MDKYLATCVLQGWVAVEGRPGYWWTMRMARLGDMVRFAGNPRYRIVNV